MRAVLPLLALCAAFAGTAVAQSTAPTRVVLADAPRAPAAVSSPGSVR